MREAAASSLSSTGVRLVSTVTTSAPARRSHADGDARPNGWRPSSYVARRRTRTASVYPCTFGVSLRHDRTPRCRRAHAGTPGAGAAARSGLLRPSPRTVDALLHRDVGALQFLRHAGAAHSLHD